MEILWMLIIGFVAGLVARFLKPGPDNMGVILTTLLGIAGAFVGGFLGSAFGVYEPTEAAGFIASVIGAILVLFVVQAFRKNRVGHKVGSYRHRKT